MKPIEQFKQNIREIQKIHDIYKFNKQQFVQGIDTDGLLRMEIVMAVSALDQYVHQIVVVKAIDILKNSRQLPANFSKLLIGCDSISNVLQSTQLSDALVFIENDIRVKLGWKSFQQPDKINEALKYISNCSIWNEVALLMSRNVTDIKNQLSLIVKRRDSIAHEADYDIVNYCQYPISDNICIIAVNFIIEVVFMIDSIIEGYVYSNTNMLQFLLQ